MGVPIDNRQPSLAITEYLMTAGIFPSHSGGPGDGRMTLGMVRMFAGNFVPGMEAAASGQTLAIAQNTALFSLVQNFYGGNGINTFALPDLRGRTALGVGQGPGLGGHLIGAATGSDTLTLTQGEMPTALGGSGQSFDNEGPSLTMTHIIRSTGSLPGSSGQDFVGEILKFGGNFAPDGYLECDGRLLSKADYPNLYSVIGTSFGGDGATTFALPDLRGRNAVGTSSTLPLGTTYGDDLPSLSPGQLPGEVGGGRQAFDNAQPGLALHYIIATTGIFPSRDTHNAAPSDQPYLGEITLFAGAAAPRGWAFCEGQLISISQNTALFSLIQNFYGGDVQLNTFRLPDFSGRTAIEVGPDTVVGQVLGSAMHQIDPGEMPDLTLVGTAGADLLRGSGGHDLLSGNGSADRLVGNAGDDVLSGGDGNDTLIGGAGHDALRGGLGNDTYVLTDRSDTIADPGGTDTIVSTISLTFTIYPAIERLRLGGAAALDGTGNALNNALTGNIAANTLSGGAGNDGLSGGDGDDRLVGGRGNDRLVGGNGHDTLIGGPGTDVLTGGPGNDVFLFNAGASTTSHDTITDFFHGHDKLQLDHHVFAALGHAGPLPPAFFRAAAAAADGNDHLIYDKATGALYYDSDGNGTHARVEIAVLGHRPTLSAIDLSVI